MLPILSLALQERPILYGRLVGRPKFLLSHPARRIRPQQSKARASEDIQGGCRQSRQLVSFCLSRRDVVILRWKLKAFRAQHPSSSRTVEDWETT
jgi:hypothetical protein